jgi:hypothetical protein
MVGTELMGLSFDYVRTVGTPELPNSIGVFERTALI